MKMSTLVLLALSLTLGFVGTFASAQTVDDQSYESYFLYLGQYPSDANPGWHQDVQGISHDSNHWFISQTGKLWKIPVDHNLSLDAFDHPDTQGQVY
jgi:hypothetical protein